MAAEPVQLLELRAGQPLKLREDVEDVFCTDAASSTVSSRLRGTSLVRTGRALSPTVGPGPFSFDRSEFADELAAAERNFAVGSRLLYEDTRIRVWDVTLEPGERLPFHRHRTTYFYRCHAGSLTRVRFPDGTGLVYESVADEVALHEIGPDELVVHDLENVGESRLSFTTAELVEQVA